LVLVVLLVQAETLVVLVVAVKLLSNMLRLRR
jgi:hypothetical protein